MLAAWLIFTSILPTHGPQDLHFSGLIFLYQQRRDKGKKKDFYILFFSILSFNCERFNHLMNINNTPYQSYGIELLQQV
jgi:hypothetical protein